ncbi:MAG: hypothetical protein ACP6IY_21565, partial [Promethearchaeia archaeon]
MFLLVLYFIVIFFNRFINGEKRKIKIFLNESIYLLFISIFLYIPYLFFLKSYGFNLIEDYILDYDRYLILLIQNKENIWNLLYTYKKIRNKITKEITRWILFDNNWEKPIFRSDNLIFSCLFIFAIISLIIPSSKVKQLQDFFTSGKLIIITIIIIFFLPYVINEISIFNYIPFWIIWRMLENYCAIIVIIETIVLDYLYNKIKGAKNHIKQLNSTIEKKMKKFFKSIKDSKLIFFKIFISIMVFFNSLSFIIYLNHIIYDIHYSDEQINSIFFIN